MPKVYDIPKEFLGAFKAGHRKTSREFIDEKLSRSLLNRIKKSNRKDKEAIKLLSFIAKFNNEYHKNVIKKGRRSDLHNTDKLRKACYDQQNARNRDAHSRFYDSIEEIGKDVMAISKDINQDRLDEFQTEIIHLIL